LSPVSYAKPERIVRNQVMLERHKQGYTLAEIARDFDLSISRVHQIIEKQRK